MSTKYIRIFASIAEFLAYAPVRTNDQAFGFVGGVLYANIAGAAVPVGYSAAAQGEVVIATKAILASENGKTFFLNAATEFVTTLPLPFAGAKFTFIVAAAPSGADYTVVTNGATETIFGKVLSAAGDAGDVENTGGATTITFVGGQSVVGDKVVVESDGTSWFAVGFSSVAAGVTFTG